MRPQSECQVPIGVKVTGGQGDDDLARVESAVAAAEASGDGDAEIPLYPGPPGKVRAPVDPTRSPASEGAAGSTATPDPVAPRNQLRQSRQIEVEGR